MTLVGFLISDLKSFPEEWEYKVGGNLINKTLGISISTSSTHYVSSPVVYRFGIIGRIRLKMACRRWARNRLKAILSDEA